ncbi:protein AGENET DOMAIN (AGD)-CONTAINING P1-like [Castanea sativa]|uniref:protein AGENET DOMAIN (AGD)-CONTAINING P1-like n=1 Tax=Castanea sativa TaxID=21020 RepID=UPI003F6498A6
MAFRILENVEICKKQEGFLGSYYSGKVLAAVGINRYIVRYETRWTECKTRQLSEVVDADEVRPLPPTISCTDFSVSDKIDAYVNNAWWVAKVVQRLDDVRYFVRLDTNGTEFLVPSYKLRIHLDWQDGRWVSPPNTNTNTNTNPNTNTIANRP